MKVNGDTDVSEVHFGFVFTSDANRVTVHRTMEHFSALSAIQPTFTLFPQPEMDSASKVIKRPSLFMDVTQRWLVIAVSERSVVPIFKGEAVQVPGR